MTGHKRMSIGWELPWAKFFPEDQSELIAATQATALVTIVGVGSGKPLPMSTELGQIRR